jgi:hypothetical protein
MFWDVYSRFGWMVDGRIVRTDTVWYSADCDADYVRRSLIDHDGYPRDLIVQASSLN